MADAAVEDKTPIVEEKAPVDRKSAIAAAIAVADKEDSKGGAEETEAKPEEKKPQESKEPDEETTLAQQGKDLMRALKDPLKAPIVIKFLAEQAGYTKSEIKSVETKAEVKELKNDILDDLREGLGEEFSVIADRLAPAIEKILTKQLEKSQADIRAKFEEQETEKLRSQSASALTKLSEEFFGADQELPDNVTTEMSKYMDRVVPASNISVKEYIEDAFNAAVGKLGLVKTNKSAQERKERNRTDASSRLASARVPSDSSLNKDNSKPMTRQEAIQAAIDAVGKEMN